MNNLSKGALKTAIAAGCSVITALPSIDAEHFSPFTLVGIGRLSALIAWTIIVREAFYFKSWADGKNGNSNNGVNNSETKNS